MITLCGFSASNYYNKVKLALLEKGVPFQESEVWTSEVDTHASPLGKVPYLLTPSGALCESTVMLDYIEQQYPAHPLVPADPFQAAKVRELATYIDLHLELVARNLYKEAFFGGKVSDNLKEKTATQLKKNIAAFASLARFTPFIGGDTFSLADCTAVAHLPLISTATKIIYGQDFLSEFPVKEYLRHLSTRATVTQVNADRKVSAEKMVARRQASQG